MNVAEKIEPWSLKSAAKAAGETLLLFALFFVYAGDPPPAINEAHYLVLAKNFWQPEWCSDDIFVSSNKPHVLFHATFGYFTQILSLPAAAWAGRMIGWLMIAAALRGLCRSCGISTLLIPAVAAVWIAGIERFNLAGEWVIGGIEAKVPAYAFVLAGITQMVKGKWTRVWPLLGLSSAFHVLVGGWTVVAAFLAYFVVGRERSALRSQLIPLALGGAVAMIGLWPALRMSAAEMPEAAIAAARIYVYSRLSHHLVPQSFPAQWYYRHAAIVVAALAAAWPLRKDRRFAAIFWLAVGSWAIAAAGLLLGLLPRHAPDLAARLLRFYWFRATDSITPLLLALAAGIHLSDAWRSSADRLGAAGLLRMSRLMPTASPAIVLAAAVMIGQSVREHLRWGIPVAARFTLHGGVAPADQRQAYRDWVSVCRWVDETLPADEVLITPRHQYTFKWYAGRAEVANWKDVPQDAESLIRWYKRFFDIYPPRLGTVRVTIQYAELRRYREQYGVRYLIVDRRIVGPTLPLVLVYPQDADSANETYAVYRLP